MSDMALYDPLSPPRSRLAGASRLSSNPRLHAVAKPYSRPEFNSNGGASNGSAAPDSPASLLHVARNHSPPKRPRSIHQQTTLPRSGSEPSGLISSFKSILSRPLAWLATPSKQLSQPTSSASTSKRGAGPVDPEDPDSPLDHRQGKRVRRFSPEKADAYAPIPDDSIRRMGASEYELPPLPANITLTRSRQTSRTPDIGGKLSGSKSMPYLDPPSSALSPAARRKAGHGPLTRSKRMEIVGFGEEPETASDFGPLTVPETPRTRNRLAKGKQLDVPFPETNTNSARSPTPNRRTAAREFALPSMSPFRPPPAPSPRREHQAVPDSPSFSTFGAVHRSQTISAGVRAPSVISDVSMTPRSVRRTGSVLFPTVHGRDDVMSVDEHPAADRSMRQRPSSTPGFQYAISRFGSMGPTAGSAVKRGPLLWDPEKGFMREDEALHAAQQNKQPIHKNDAERILFALESMRSTPLADARKGVALTSQDLVGASSRALRKAINVPLATSQAEEGQMSRHAKERLGDTPVSSMISPYGRRRQQDKVNREARRDRTVEMEQESDYRPSTSPMPSYSKSPSRSERASRSASRGMSADRDSSPPTQSTPRRSTRIRHRGTSVEPEQETPRRQRTRKAGSSSRKTKEPSAEPTTAAETPRRKRRTPAKKSVSTSPPPAGHVSAPPAVPTIMETAPSPSASARSSSGYAPLADGSSRSNASSLRARSSHSKRVHEGAASLNSSREPSPFEGGRYSAKEEDLPDMDELESSKISTQSFTGFKFGDFGAPPASQSNNTPAATLRPEPAANPASASLTVPSASPAQSRLSSGPLARLSSSRPRASSPLANNSVVAARDSDSEDSPKRNSTIPAQIAPQPDVNGFTPFSFSRSGTATPTEPPPLFSNVAAPTPAIEPAKKSLGFGIGKPTTEDKSVSEKPAFSFTTTAPTPPPPAPTFNFGLDKAEMSAKSSPAASTTFNFGLPASAPAKTVDNATGSSSGSVTPTFNFGLPKADHTAPPASAPGGFSFGSSALSKGADENSEDAERPRKQPFSFGSTSAAPAPAAAKEATKSLFSFGAPATTPATTSTASTPAREAPKPFSFGVAPAASSVTSTDKDSAKPAASSSAPFASTDKAETSEPSPSFGSAAASASKPDGAPKPSFSFGAAPVAATESTTPKAAPTFSFGGSTGRAEKKDGPKPTFSLGGPSAAPPATEPKPATSGFSFGAAQPVSASGAKDSNSLGLSSTTGSSSGFTFGNSAAKSPTPASAPPAFTFGASTPSTATSEKANPFGQAGSASQPNGTVPTSFPFGSSTPTPASSGFSFGNTPAASGTPGFGTQAQQGSAGNGFGFGSTPNSDSNGASGSTTGFGNVNTSAFGSSANNAASGFGSQPSAAPTSPFGGPNSSTSANGGFSFGSAPASATGGQSNAFGSASTPANNQQPFAFTFGNTAPAPSPAASNAPFTFGATSSQPSTPTGAPSAPFTFGAQASQPNGNQPNSATPFQFGQPGPASAGTTTSPFQFGAAPADGQPGFSPGLAPPTTPGSPHGRKIAGKPRRRGTMGK